MKKIIFLLFSFLIYLFPISVSANDEFVTLVNPVRISGYNPDPVASFKAQYAIVKGFNFPATWLVTFDVLNNPSMVKELKTLDTKQELGIFLEVTPEFSNAAKVLYNESGGWHYAKSVFLSGYKPEARKILIDTVFERFYQELGYYPKSVGSWWTDAYSLQYLVSKYKITANLGCSDQFKTDGYQLWGQYWSIPFYPNKFNPAMPASTFDSKLDLVNLQWAARDPYRGYIDSLYSTQDYFTKPNLPNSYFEKLVKLYASKNENEFGQITVGLEGDFTPDAYQGVYKSQLEIIKKLEPRFKVTTMADFSAWYRNSFQEFSPEHTLITDDLLGNEITTTWYQSPKYRVGIVYDKVNDLAKVIDLRFYSDAYYDPYFNLLNGHRDLFINIPSVIDTITKPESGLDISQNYKTLDLSNIESILPKPTPTNDLIIRDLVPKIPFAIRSRLGYLSNTTSVFLLGMAFLMSLFFIPKARVFILFTSFVGMSILFLPKYFISLYEVEALNYLSLLPKGKILVFDSDCSRCKWDTPHKPAAMANKRSYVAKLSKKPIFEDISILVAKDSAQAKQTLKDQKIRYIYLAKYSGYIEDTRFPAKDLNLTKVYENSNATIWKFNEYSD